MDDRRGRCVERRPRQCRILLRGCPAPPIFARDQRCRTEAGRKPPKIISARAWGRSTQKPSNSLKQRDNEDRSTDSIVLTIASLVSLGHSYYLAKVECKGWRSCGLQRGRMNDMAMKNRAVSGIYSTDAGVQSGIDALRAARFRTTDTAALIPENQGSKDLSHERSDT